MSDTQLVRDTTMSKYRCPECGFRIFNRRVPRCESCGSLLPEELLLTAEERAALDAAYEKSATQRAEQARAKRRAGRGDSDVLIDGFSSGGGGDG